MSNFKLPSVTTHAQTAKVAVDNKPLSQSGYQSLSQGVGAVADVVKMIAIKRQEEENLIAEEDGMANFNSAQKNYKQQRLPEYEAELNAAADGVFYGKDEQGNVKKSAATERRRHGAGRRRRGRCCRRCVA